ncbi:beta-galactosidase 3-like [Zingiber officinale]|uniref:beta-galactosidase 3-like n=1 Tax=Zingiber officinale TaxID=94328 RepID=UPI001C4D58C1|nr:beta-galactosidase 3-like [Zingiber officinale]
MARGSRLFFLLFFLFAPVAIAVHNVTYDARSLIIDGERKLIISGSIHYPRSVPSMWPGLVAAAKEGGLNTIETYVFWNGHEPSPGNYYFQERFDLVKFAKIVRDAGLYMILRIGPFVGAEWTYGGIPVWLHYVPGTVFRTNNEPFKRHMENFITYIVNLMKREQLFASQGGHIILAQVENEYGFYEGYYGDAGKQYAMWSAHMALNQRTGVPWVMCQQDDAPDPVINSCNSFYCDQFTPNSPSKPKFWTENWPGWFHTFGEPDPHRPPEDIAFAVARFFQKGGSLQNYYMYHGGTHYGRTTGGPFITTSYDYNAPIDEYGLPRLPKWGHLRELHGSIKLCEHTLLYGESEFFSVGPLQEVNVYKDKFGGCVAFLANIDEQEYKFITFRNVRYSVPPWSVSILPDCKNVVFNTAKVRSQASVVEMVPENLQASSTSSLGLGAWQIYTEKVGLWDKPDFEQFGLKDHLNVTKDTTDYLWYTTSFYVGESEEIIGNGSSPILSVESKGHAFLLFINGELQGSSYGNSGNLHLRFQAPVVLKTGQNEIAILSMTIGMYNAGPLYEWQGAGLTSVKISGNRIGSLDLSTNLWKYKIGLQGERYNIFNTDITDIKWIPVSEPPKNQALIWYKVAVDPPEGNEPVALDMLSMGKGHVWVNGKSIGRYWLVTSSIYAKCTPHCNYTGKFKPDKCLTRCGEPTQRWYHIPRSFFKSSGNTLIIFEERGGDPTKITFAKRHETMICSFISEDHPELDLKNWDVNGNDNAVGGALMNLKCPEGTSISSIIFASFGNPSGTCSSYRQGSCHYSNSISVIEKACLHRNECSISFVNESFTEEDLCPGITKALAVEAACS